VSDAENQTETETETGGEDDVLPRVIAIDGPAGSGKSTVARLLAETLGLDYLDTGAMYRAVAFAALRRGMDPDDIEPVGRLARDVELEVGTDEVSVDGVDATIEIRGPEVTRAVSAVAANPEVRAELRTRQRDWARVHGGGVIEGRDIGSVVFPDAELKLYLTARPEVRAARRSKEVTDMDYETVAADIARRDALDQGREDSPLTESDEAVTVDTSDHSIDEVVQLVVEYLS
jgi:cytidylate kinase